MYRCHWTHHVRRRPTRDVALGVSPEPLASSRGPATDYGLRLAYRMHAIGQATTMVASRLFFDLDDVLHPPHVVCAIQAVAES